MSTIKRFKQILGTLLACLLVFGIISPADAQIDKWTDKMLKRAKDRSTRKVEQKTNQTVDKTVDKAFDKVFKKVDDAFEGKDKDKKNKSKKNDENAGNEGDPSTYENSKVTIIPGEADPNVQPSDWIGSFRMRTEESKNGKMQDGYPQNTTIHVDEYKVAFETKEAGEGSSGIVIIDRQYRKITTKTIDEEGNKNAVTIPIPSAKIQVEDTEGDLNESRDGFRKTGRTKTIANYRCEEYAFENEEVKSSIWLSTTMGADFRKFFSWISIEDKKKGGYSSYDEFYPVSGSVMESTSIDKENGTVNHMVVEDVQKGRVQEDIFSLNGYNHQDMSELLNTPEGKQMSEFFKKMAEKAEEDDKN